MFLLKGRTVLVCMPPLVEIWQVRLLHVGERLGNGGGLGIFGDGGPTLVRLCPKLDISKQLERNKCTRNQQKRAIVMEKLDWFIDPQVAYQAIFPGLRSVSWWRQSRCRQNSWKRQKNQVDWTKGINWLQLIRPLHYFQNKLLIEVRREVTIKKKMGERGMRYLIHGLAKVL